MSITHDQFADDSTRVELCRAELSTGKILSLVHVTYRGTVALRFQNILPEGKVAYIHWPGAKLARLLVALERVGLRGELLAGPADASATVPAAPKAPGAPRARAATSREQLIAAGVLKPAVGPVASPPTFARAPRNGRTAP
jgi:hypothetical protein